MYEGELFKAIQFVSQKHKDQLRKSFNYPYITHPLMVFHMVSRYSEDSAVQLAALLHDTVEDTDTSLEEIEKLFGKKVQQYVDYLSENKELPWLERKKRYAQGFIGAPREVLLIKAADIVYNLSDTLEVIERYPQDDFAKKISDPNWIEQKKEIITIIKKEWPENPFILKVSSLCALLDKKITQAVS